MLTTHVSIVDSETFPYHLEYLFAGTGSKNDILDFNGREDSELHSGVERKLVSMISDSQRTRKGDYVIFYLQQNISESIFEGKFYGLFKVASDFSFLDNNDGNQFLIEGLGKSLLFRTLIEPLQVYSLGVSELWNT